MKTEINIEQTIKYLNNTLNQEQKQAFENWLGESDENKKQYMKIKLYWDTSAKAFDDYFPDKELAWQKVQLRTEKSNLRLSFFSSKLLKIAAVLLIILAIGSIFFRYLLSDKYSSDQMISYTSGDSIKKVELADGSVVWLNKNAELKAPEAFKENKRLVYLSGEGFFEVKTNAAQPFEVITGSTVTRVLGTSFIISQNNGNKNVSIIVSTGKVAFFEKDNEENKLTLTPGEKGLYKAGNTTLEKENNTDPNFLSWKTGKLEFYKTPLSDMCKTLSKLYNVHFKIDEQKAKEYSFTGKFINKPITEILSITGETLNVKFKLEQNICIVEFN